jgi:hypothetical protein
MIAGARLLLCRSGRVIVIAVLGRRWQRFRRKHRRTSPVCKPSIYSKRSCCKSGTI